MKLRYKLVCWDDFSIPVPVGHKWLTWDKSGQCYSSEIEPRVKSGLLEISIGNCWLATPGMQLLTGCNIPPPEPGPWNKQLYWIG